MPTWPAAAPQAFDEQGFSDELPGQLLRSALDGGREKTRRLARRSTRAKMSGRITMTVAEWDAVTEFYEQDIGKGALAFDFPDPDDPGATVSVAFTEPPRLVTVGGELHTISLSLERQ